MTTVSDVSDLHTTSRPQSSDVCADVNTIAVDSVAGSVSDSEYSNDDDGGFTNDAISVYLAWIKQQAKDDVKMMGVYVNYGIRNGIWNRIWNEYGMA